MYSISGHFIMREIAIASILHRLFPSLKPILATRFTRCSTKIITIRQLFFFFVATILLFLNGITSRTWRFVNALLERPPLRRMVLVSIRKPIRSRYGHRAYRSVPVAPRLWRNPHMMLSGNVHPNEDPRACVDMSDAACRAGNRRSPHSISAGLAASTSR